MKTTVMYRKIGIAGAFIASGVLLGTFGPLRGVLSKQIDPQEIQNASQTPPNIPQSFEQLAHEAELMLVDMKLIIDWTKAVEDEPLLKEAYALSFQIDSEFTTPLSTVVVDAWAYGKEGERYTGHSVEQFWAVYNVLQKKHRFFREQMSGVLKDLAKSSGITIHDYTESSRINAFRFDKRTP